MILMKAQNLIILCEYAAEMEVLCLFTEKSHFAILQLHGAGL
jgi:hypothetical protein